MKHIIIFSILFTGLFCLSDKLKNKQLFDAISNEFPINNETPKAANSIFSAVSDDQNTNNINLIQKNEDKKSKSIFDTKEESKSESKSLFESDYHTPGNVKQLVDNSIFNNNGKSLFDNPEQSVAGNNKSNINSNPLSNNPKKSLFYEDLEVTKPKGNLNSNVQNQLNKNTIVKSNKPIKHPKPKNKQANNNSIAKPQEHKGKSLFDKRNEKIYHENETKDSKVLIRREKGNKDRKEKIDKLEKKHDVNNINNNNFIVEDSEFKNKKDEIEKLKSKISNLMNINSELLNEIEKKKKLKKKTLDISDELINLIEKRQEPITELQQRLQKTSAKASKKFEVKEAELKDIYDNVRQNLDHLLDNVSTAKNSLNKISSDESFLSGELKKNYDAEKIKVSENVGVDGLAIATRINTDSIDIGNIKIDLEKINILNPNMEIIVGSNILSIRELMENLDIMERFQFRCGYNLENCVLYNNNKFNDDIERQNEILRDLKKLRKRTKKLINNNEN